MAERTKLCECCRIMPIPVIANRKYCKNCGHGIKLERTRVEIKCKMRYEKMERELKERYMYLERAKIIEKKNDKKIF